MEAAQELINNIFANPYSIYIAAACAVFLIAGILTGIKFFNVLLLLFGAGLTALIWVKWGDNIWGKIAAWIAGLWFVYLFVQKLTHWK